MTLDDMMDTWRAQDEAPLYGVNRDLLQLVLRHEQADLRRAIRVEQWTVYGVGGGMLAFLVLLFAAIYHDDDPRTVWDYVAAGLGTAAALLWVGAFWLARKRQALRERGFGSTLQAEIRRNLSLIEHQLSRVGRWQRAVLTFAPMIAAAVAIYWLVLQINNEPLGLFHAAMLLFIVVACTQSAIAESRRVERELRPQEQRLSGLLDMLNAGE